MNTRLRPPKITLIGAGSAVFTRNLLGDILSYPELAQCEIALHDIDEKRLHLAEMVAHRIAATVGASPTITARSRRPMKTIMPRGATSSR